MNTNDDFHKLLTESVSCLLTKAMDIDCSSIVQLEDLNKDLQGLQLSITQRIKGLLLLQ